MLDLVQLHNRRLLQSLECKRLARLLVLDQSDTAKGASAQHGGVLQILQLHLAHGLLHRTDIPLLRLCTRHVPLEDAVEGPKDRLEALGREHKAGDVGDGSNGGSTPVLSDEGTLTKVTALRQTTDLSNALVAVFNGNDSLTLAENEELVSLLALSDNSFPGIELGYGHGVRQLSKLLLRQMLENVNMLDDSFVVCIQVTIHDLNQRAAQISERVVVKVHTPHRSSSNNGCGTRFMLDKGALTKVLASRCSCDFLAFLGNNDLTVDNHVELITSFALPNDNVASVVFNWSSGIRNQHTLLMCK
eukprot:Colp12_sorted_trinity150504_noHs@18368